METIEILQRTVDYIEDHLKTELSATELAEYSSFSVYHLYHLFQTYIGMSLFSYITKRRLLHAVYDAQSGIPLIKVALTYGFDTHAGFYKAFKRHFGCSVSQYSKLRTVKKPKRYNIKVEGRMMLTQAQVKQQLSKWDIGPIEQIENCYLMDKKLSHVFTINESYIFKSGKNISNLRTHISITDYLNQLGYPSGKLVKTIDYEDFVVENECYYVLYHKVSGEPLKVSQLYMGDRFVIGKQYGVAIGHLHIILNKEQNQIDVPNKNMFDTIFNWALPECRKYLEQWGMALPTKFYDDYELNFRRLYHHLPQQVIHRDIHASNIIFHQGQVSGFIDFDIAERNIRMFDPVYCATSMLSESHQIENGYELWLELLKGILIGYNEIGHFTKEEKEAIIYIIYSIQFIFIAWMGDQDQFKDLAFKNQEMLLWLWEQQERIAKIIDTL